MGEILGLGLTHYPPLGGQDENMAWILQHTLKDPDIPEEAKQAESWPDAMQEEWGDDEARSAAERHREAIVAGLRRCRQALDDFNPDVVIVWGDDQYENFKEDIIPPFCVGIYEDRKVKPWADSTRENVWGEDESYSLTVRGRPEVGKELVTSLIRQGFDVSYAYEPLHDDAPHAFLNAILFLDYDRIGFDYPVIQFQVNCYGSRVISYRGGASRFADRDRPLDPPSPNPGRCLDIGAATARAFQESDLRVALVASSSWSHAFLTDKTWRLYPDVESDRRLYEAMVEGNIDVWRAQETPDIEESGQQEVLNWYCLVGAMEELGRRPNWSEFVETYVFNSTKVFAIYT